MPGPPGDDLPGCVGALRAARAQTLDLDASGFYGSNRSVPDATLISPSEQGVTVSNHHGAANLKFPRPSPTSMCSRPPTTQAARRCDPFFADADGSFHGFNWTGQDAFANRNTLSIVLDVPTDLLGPGPSIGVRASVSVRRDGELVQVDRGGHPTINPFVNPNDVKDQFNVRQPVDDVADYPEPWSRLLQDQGGYPPDDARAHDDVTAEFPHLGLPNPNPAG
jgi:hypothetical protein